MSQADLAECHQLFPAEDSAYGIVWIAQREQSRLPSEAPGDPIEVEFPSSAARLKRNLHFVIAGAYGDSSLQSTPIKPDVA